SLPLLAALVQFSVIIRLLFENLFSELNVVTYSLLLFVRLSKQSFDHDLPVLHSLFQWLLPELLFRGLIIAALVTARRLPLLTFGVAWFFVQLLPTSLIPRIDLLSERNLYLASIGLLLVVVMIGSRVTQWLATVLRK